MIFAKIKDKSERKITYAQFEKGLEFFAEKKGCTPADILEKILATGGPQFSGT